MQRTPFQGRLDQLADTLDSTTYKALLDVLAAEIRLAIDGHRHGIGLARAGGVNSTILERRLADLQAKLSTIERMHSASISDATD